MSSREKNLLFLMCGIMFFVLNVFAFKTFYTPKILAAQNSAKQAEIQLKRAEMVLSKREEWEKTRKWLENNEGKPTTHQQAETKLQAFVERQAKSQNLDVRKQGVLEHIEGQFYTRVRVSYRVSGRENEIQRWLMQIHQPRQFQVITKLVMKPQRKDLTMLDCEVEVEKFIVPAEQETPL